jgi:transketolase
MTDEKEDVAARFLAYGWNVVRVGDVNDIARIESAFDIFRQTHDRPTFIVLTATSATVRHINRTRRRPTASLQ